MSSDEEKDELMDLEKIQQEMMNIPTLDRMQVSAWEVDEDGIDESLQAEDSRQNAILDAAENGNLDLVKKYISSDPSLVESTDRDGYTPLHRACYGNHTEIVKFLLESGARINAKTQDDWQPLHSACCWNNVDCAAVLVQHGADINAKSKGNQTPLHLLSASSQNQACLQLFLMHPDLNPHIRNSSGDTAYDIAKRTGKYYPIFEITEPYLNEI